MKIGLGRRRQELQFGEAEALGHPRGHVLLLLGVWSLILVTPSPEFTPALGHRGCSCQISGNRWGDFAPPRRGTARQTDRGVSCALRGSLVSVVKQRSNSR